MKKLTLKLLALTLSFGAALSAYADLQPYTATYYAKFGSLSGKNISTLRKNEETGVFTYSSVTKPRGIAALAGKIKESAGFTIEDSKIKPITFYHSSRKEKAVVSYDWDKGIAASRADGESKEVTLNGDELDLLSLQMQLMQDISGNDLKPEYTVIKDNALKTYAVTMLAEENITIAKNSYDTVKLKQQRAGSSRHTIIWLAKDLQYTVVQMEQYKGDKLRGSMALTGYKLAKNK